MLCNSNEFKCSLETYQEKNYKFPLLNPFNKKVNSHNLSFDHFRTEICVQNEYLNYKLKRKMWGIE